MSACGDDLRFKDQVVYLKNSFGTAVLRRSPDDGGRIFIKYRGEEEFEIDPLIALVIRTFNQATEITEKEYYEF